MSYVYLRDHPHKDKILELAPRIVGRFASRLTSRGKGDEWLDRLDYEAVMDSYHDMAYLPASPGLDTVILAGTHLLTFSIGAPWFNPGKRWLTEQFFTRIGTGPAASAYEALDDLARDLRVDATVMATSLAPNDEALGKLYEEQGYRLQSSQYIKDHQWQFSAPLLPGSPPLPV